MKETYQDKLFSVQHRGSGFLFARRCERVKPTSEVLRSGSELFYCYTWISKEGSYYVKSNVVTRTGFIPFSRRKESEQLSFPGLLLAAPDLLRIFSPTRYKFGSFLNAASRTKTRNCLKNVVIGIVQCLSTDKQG